MSLNQNILVKLKQAGFRINGKWLVKGVSLQIEKGKIVTLIGPNGSGKSTTAKIALGIYKKIEGEVEKYTNKVGYVTKKIKIINSLQIPFNIIDHRLIELLQNKKKYVIFIRSILLRGNIKNKKICFNNNKKITNQIQEIVKNYEKQNYIKFAVKFVKFFKKADFYLFGFNNIKQIKDIKNLFNQKPLNKNKIENFVKQIQKLNLKDKVDLRNWNN